MQGEAADVLAADIAPVVKQYTLLPALLPPGFNFPLLSNGLWGPPNDVPPPPPGWVLALLIYSCLLDLSYLPILCSLLAQSPCLLGIP